MPTEEELEQRITDQIDRERLENAILFGIESLTKAVEKGADISGLFKGEG